MSSSNTTSTRTRVVILGGGFGGLQAARSLRGSSFDVVVVDRHNHHLFQPLLYQVATAGLTESNVASPIRKVLRHQKNASVLFADARGFDLASRKVLLDRGEVEYDRLIIATGATHSYFGHPGWADHAPGLKTLADARNIRARILRAFEEAEREEDPQERQPWLEFVVVGAGPTGVEMAGAIAELARHTLPRDFRRFDPGQARIVLVEGADRVLPSYPAELSEKARRQLQRLGVEVRTGAEVTDIDDRGVSIGTERIEARTVIWGAGVQASALLRELGTPLDRAGRAVVEPDLSLPGHPEVFVIGDAASVVSDGEPVPGLAPAAVQMGSHAARNIRRAESGLRPLPFRYRDVGLMATIGRAAAVAKLGRWHVSGLPAWLLWTFVHVFFLIGFRSRLIVLFEWAWSWLTFQRVARVITEPVAADGETPVEKPKLRRVDPPRQSVG